ARVGLLRRVGWLRHGGVVWRGEGLDEVLDGLVRRANANHEDGAGPVPGSDGDVGGARRTVQVVPLAHVPLGPLDDGRAFAGEDEEALLIALGVVAAVGLSWLEDMNTDAELGGRRIGSFEDAPDTLFGRAVPPYFADIEDEPAVALGDAPRGRV